MFRTSINGSIIVTYMSFNTTLPTVLYQFLETGTLDITLIGLDQLLKCSGFNQYLLSFFLMPCIYANLFFTNCDRLLSYVESFKP